MSPSNPQASTVNHTLDDTRNDVQPTEATSLGAKRKSTRNKYASQFKLVAAHRSASALSALDRCAARYAVKLLMHRECIKKLHGHATEWISITSQALQWSPAVLAAMHTDYLSTGMGAGTRAGKSNARLRAMASNSNESRDENGNLYVAQGVIAAQLANRISRRSMAEEAVDQLLDNQDNCLALAHTTLAWLDSGDGGSADFNNTNLARNASFLASALGLNASELAILQLAMLTEANGSLTEVFEMIDLDQSSQVFSALATLCDLTVDQISVALNGKNLLAASGLLDISGRGSCNELLRWVKLGSRFDDYIHAYFESEQALLATYLRPVAKTELTLADFDYLGTLPQLAQAALTRALETKPQGINILVYGAPGTGKTAFVSALAAAVSAPLYQVGCTDSDGDPMRTGERLADLRLANTALKGAGASLLMFDEIEDVFPHKPDGFFAFARKSKDDVSKAWLNHALENSTIPTLWVSNEIDQIDEANLRRFTLHIEFNHPPVRVRERLVRRAFGELGVSDAFVHKIAGFDKLAPAHLSQASTLVSLLAPSSPAEAERVIEQQLTLARSAMQLPAHSQTRHNPVDYDARFVRLQGNTTVPTMLAALQSKGDNARAALCFWGQPGTGKTELAHHIAQSLGRSLIVKTGSDLRSMWVGETERNIARMFKSAALESATNVLLLDEADSLLRDRSQAQANFEVNFTNEFLAQMERFPGLFICTTNLFAQLDPAVLRRFQFRLEFLCLDAAQARAMFAHSFSDLAALGEEGAKKLDKLRELVPADFANVRRQVDFLGAPVDAAGLIEQLREELHTRRGESGVRAAGMGFV